MHRRLRAALAAAALLALAGAGCGDGDGEQSGVTLGVEAEAGVGGTLAYALSEEPRELDPLFASSRADRLVTRQIHEPLVTELTGPFGDVRRLRGLAHSWRASADGEIWSFELRRRVRFQDGSPFDASAVLANVDRWQALPGGSAPVPGLLAADAPRPDLVRFILAQPLDDLPRVLASPRLGIVSPRALRDASVGTSLRNPERSGTGPFEFRESGRDEIVLARNDTWWGTRLELGPALDQLSFVVVPAQSDRLALLRRGEAQVADSLARSAISELRADPLLTFVSDAGWVLAFERSVRGVESANAIQPLSNVWLTTLGPG
jgi:peptide/nickel transport system substrate-binding protein